MFTQLVNPQIWDVFHEGALKSQKNPVTLRLVEPSLGARFCVGLKFDSKEQLVEFLKKALEQCEKNPEEQYVAKKG